MIDVKVDIRPVLRAFDRVKNVDGRKVFRSARRPMRADMRMHAKDQAGPSGAWPVLASSTLERRARGGKRRRRSAKMLGRLPFAMIVTSGVDFVRGVSPVKWSNVHWKGGSAGHGARIPQRMFWWISKGLKTAVRDLFTSALDRAWAGR